MPNEELLRRQEKIREVMDRFPTQKEFAEAIGMKGPRISKALKPENASDRRLAPIERAIDEWKQAESSNGKEESQIPTEAGAPKGLSDEQLEKFGLVRIAHTNVEAGAGDEREVDFVEEDGATVMPRWYVRQEFGVRPERVKRIKVRGDSMRPTLREGENAYMILMTAGERVQSGLIYMIHGPGGFQVKRLKIESEYDPATGDVNEFMMICSDNPEEDNTQLPLNYFRQEYRVVAYFAKTEKDL